MSYPTMAVRASLGTDRFDTPAWDDLAGAAQSLSISTGRRSELEDATPGVLTVGLDNADRSFDPTYAAGPWFGELTPGKRVQVEAMYDPTDGATDITYVGVGTFQAGDAASLTPPLPVGWQENDLLLIAAYCRNSAATIAVPAGWTEVFREPGGRSVILGRIAQSGDTAPTVVVSDAASGDTTLAQCIAFRGTERDFDWLLAAENIEFSIGSQNIDVPATSVTEDGTAVVIFGFKADDWTGVAELSGQGFTEAAENDSTLGNDAGMVIDYRINTAAAGVLDTFFTVTGGVTADGEATVLAIRPFRGVRYQVFNGYADGWPNEYHRRAGRATMRASGPFQILARTTLPDPYEVAVLEDTPQAFYRLNETDGTVLVDSSEFGRHGRWVPSAHDVSTTQGLIQGSDSAVSLPADPSWSVGVIPRTAIPNLRPLAIEFWCKIDKVPAPLDAEQWLNGHLWSGILFRGGINIRVWSTATAFPGALDFIVNDGPTLSTTDIASATTAEDPYFFSICDGRVHHVVCQINSSANLLQIWVDGVNRDVDLSFTGLIDALTPAYTEIDLNPGGGWEGSAIIDEIAFYASTLTGDQIRHHHQQGRAPFDRDTTGERVGNALDLIDWPADLRDIDTGDVTLRGADTAGGSNALDYLNLITATEQGWLSEAHDDAGKVRFEGRSARLAGDRATTAQLEFSDDASDLAAGAIAYSDIGLATDNRPAANIVTVKWAGGESTARNQASVDTYGEANATIETLMATPGEASGLAEWILETQDDVFTRVHHVTVRPSAMTGDVAHAAWAACLGLREGDRVSVTHRPADVGTALVQELHVIGIEHSTTGLTWETTFYFGRAVTTTYWALDSGALGTDTRLAY